MKSKLKIISITFAATTVFWCLVTAGFFWCGASPDAGNDAISQLRRLGYHYLLVEQNLQDGNSTLVVDAIYTNFTGAALSKVELLRTNLTPAQTMLLGLRRELGER
jgi:hypothetical protein